MRQRPPAAPVRRATDFAAAGAEFARTPEQFEKRGPAGRKTLARSIHCPLDTPPGRYLEEGEHNEVYQSEGTRSPRLCRREHAHWRAVWAEVLRCVGRRGGDRN